MIKKISAVVLALVLCLSVVVVPASALDLGSADIAYELKWDKEYYSAGETAYLQVFMKASEDLELHTGSILIGTNSAQITNDTTQVDAIGSDLWNSFWAKPVDSQGGWQAATITGRVNTANNDTEKALYDQYLKIVISRNTSGGHANAGDNKQGLPGADINALADAGKPIITFQFKVADGVADGTKLNAAITTGSRTCSPAQTAFKYIKTPGTATTTANVTATSIDVSAAVAEATVGTPAPACDHTLIWKTTTEPTYTTTGVETGTCECGEKTETRPIAMKVLVSALKGQMRYNLDDDTKFDVRALAKIPAADFQAAFGDTVNAKAMIKEAGFVFASGENITTPDMDAVKALVKDGTEVTGYAKKPITYISDSISSGNYVFSCLVTGLDEDTVSSEDQSLIAIGYIAWDADKDGVVDSYAFYPETQTIEFAKLYANKK